MILVAHFKSAGIPPANCSRPVISHIITDSPITVVAETADDMPPIGSDFKRMFFC